VSVATGILARRLRSIESVVLGMLCILLPHPDTCGSADSSGADADSLEPIQVGEVRLSNPNWPALADIPPLDAADLFVASFNSWLRDATGSAA
jgi:hypothetical protein